MKEAHGAVATFRGIPILHGLRTRTSISAHWQSAPSRDAADDSSLFYLDEQSWVLQRELMCSLYQESDLPTSVRAINVFSNDNLSKRSYDLSIEPSLDYHTSVRTRFSIPPFNRESVPTLQACLHSTSILLTNFRAQ